MPCNDGWNNARGCDGTCNLSDVKALRTRNDKLAQMLCGICTRLQRAGQDRSQYPHTYIQDVKGLVEWWKEHQEHDRKREAQEREEKQRRAERQARIAARQEKRERELLVQLAGKFGKRII